MARFGKADPARVVASPEFCIPTSIATAFFLGGSIPKITPIRYPHRYPSRLCRMTTAKITGPVERIFSLLCDTTAATIRHMAVTETAGRMPLIFCVFYSGEPGSHSAFNKWFFYVFYPLHLLVLWYFAYLA